MTDKNTTQIIYLFVGLLILKTVICSLELPVQKLCLAVIAILIYAVQVERMHADLNIFLPESPDGLYKYSDAVLYYPAIWIHLSCQWWTHNCII